jgi:FkbM family methyltransferase
MNPSEVTNFKDVLDELMPKVGRYEWIWKLLRARARRNGGRIPEKALRLMKKWINPGKPYFITTTSDGTRFMGDIRDLFSVVHAVLPHYDEHVRRFIVARMREGEGAYIDVGANFGIFAATVDRMLEGARPIVAFEPVAETAKRAAATFALNKVRNVRLLQLAIGEIDGQITLLSADGNSALASRQHDSVRGTTNTLQVGCNRLDTLMAEGVLAQPVRLLKVDVEGFEPEVIKGAEQLIRRDRPAVLFEYNLSFTSPPTWSATEVAAMIGRGGAYLNHVLLDGGDLGAFPPPADARDCFNIYCDRPAAIPAPTESLAAQN